MNPLRQSMIEGGRILLLGVVLVAGVRPAVAAAAAVSRFYFGNDLSYVNQMEDCGAVYRENDVAKDPFQLMADHGTNLVRVRLWHDPWWQPLLPQTAPGAKPQYNDLADVTKTIQRAKTAGMHVMLDIHFSDFWADPGRQVMPRAWSALANDDAALEVAVYDYVGDVLRTLNTAGLMPEIVKLGNESNGGIMLRQTLTASWNAASQQLDIAVGGVTRGGDAYVARMWNAAIRAVREVGTTAAINPKIALHSADLDHLVGFYDWMQSIGVTDFDIMGFSYYYAWHGASIGAMGNAIRALKARHPRYEAMVVETGYIWDQQNIDGLGNIINTPDPAYLPVSPANQRLYMVDFTQEVINAGGSGVIFWEPLWVSTPCRTPWGVGSSHEHVAYFDHRNNLNFHVGGTWMEATYTGLPPPPAIAVQPVAMTALLGSSAFFSVHATGDNLTYQWRRDNVDLPGAHAPSLFLSGVDATDVGTYSVVVRNGFGAVESVGRTLRVVPTGSARPINLSARARVGVGTEVLIPGLVVQGDVALTVLVRAIGPGLAEHGVDEVLEDPVMRVFRSVPGGTSEEVAANDNWEDNENLAALSDATAEVGAFALASGSADAAMLLTVNPGAYTVAVSGANNTAGVALMEIYVVAP